MQESFRSPKTCLKFPQQSKLHKFGFNFSLLLLILLPYSHFPLKRELSLSMRKMLFLKWICKTIEICQLFLQCQQIITRAVGVKAACI